MATPAPANNCAMKSMMACTNVIASKVMNSIKMVIAVKVGTIKYQVAAKRGEGSDGMAHHYPYPLTIIWI